MKAREYKSGRVFAGRLQHNSDLLQDILDFASREGIKAAFFSALGAVQKVTLAYYHQDAKKYEDITFNEHLEVVACFGNISVKDGQPHIHAHGVFTDKKGKSIGGHIQPGTIIFAGEIFLQEIVGEPLNREYDEVTGLFLWKI